MPKKSSLHTALFTVTPFSKLLALTLFILLPIVAFFLGMYVESQIIFSYPQSKLQIDNMSPQTIVEPKPMR